MYGARHVGTIMVDRVVVIDGKNWCVGKRDRPGLDVPFVSFSFLSPHFFYLFCVLISCLVLDSPLSARRVNTKHFNMVVHNV